MKSKINVLHVEYDEVYRDGFNLFLKSNRMVSKIYQASNGREAMAFLENTWIDLIFMDIRMPEMNGIEATKNITEKYKHVKIVALSAFDDRISLLNMIKAGAFGYLTKSTPKDEVNNALDQICAGNHYYAREIEGFLTNKPGNKVLNSSTFRTINSLTKREIEIVRLICQSYNTKEISNKLAISEGTVEAHRSHIYNKLEIENQLQLFFFGLDFGLIDPPPKSKSYLQNFREFMERKGIEVILWLYLADFLC